MQTSVPWDDVHLFLVLYRSRTMGDAAHTLGVNISTVSRRLNSLEASLEAVLFERGRDGLRATAAAEALLLAAEQAEGAVASFANAVDTLERDVSGTVRIACPPDMAEVVILPVLHEVLQDHPHLHIQIAPGEAVLDLARREADVAVRIVRPTRGDLVSRRVMTVTWTPAASPELAAHLGDVTDLEAVPWIGWGPGYADAPASRWLDGSSLQPRLQTARLRTQIAAAQAGLGVALVPHTSLDHYGLVPITIRLPAGDPSERLPRSDVFMVTHRTLRAVPRVKVVWEALLNHLQSRFG